MGEGIWSEKKHKKRGRDSLTFTEKFLNRKDKAKREIGLLVNEINRLKQKGIILEASKINIFVIRNNLASGNYNEVFKDIKKVGEYLKMVEDKYLFLSEEQDEIQELIDEVIDEGLFELDYKTGFSEIRELFQEGRYDEMLDITKELKNEIVSELTNYRELEKMINDLNGRYLTEHERGLEIPSKEFSELTELNQSGSYDEARDILSRLEQDLTVHTEKYRTVEKALLDAEKMLEEYKRYMAVSDAEKKLEDARILFNDCSYDSCMAAVEDCMDKFNDARISGKPELILSINPADDDLKPDVFNRCELTLLNTGETHANNVKIDIQNPELTVKGLEEPIDLLKSGEEESIEIAVKTTEAGSIPAEVKIQCSNIMNDELITFNQKLWLDFETQANVEWQQTRKNEPANDNESGAAILVKSAVNCEHAKVVYKIKIENNTNSSISDVSITPFVAKEIFMLDEPEKTISLIKKGEAKSTSFVLRPRGECGNVDISGKVRYYDTVSDEYKELKVEPRKTELLCPMLKIKSIDEDRFREYTYQMVSVKESIEEIPISMEELFDLTSDVINDMNMFMLQPKIGTNRSLARFYAEGIKGFKYGAQIEVIGGLQSSKLILKAFAENEECLIGFYHKILDEIEERTNIKQYVKDPLIIKGDYFPGGKKIEIKDSVLQKTNIE